MSDETLPLPRYQCHKVVEALKIEAITPAPSSGALIHPADTRYPPFRVSTEFMMKHQPRPGGYWVRYDGGAYESYSPAKPFEEGYTCIDGIYPPPPAAPIEPQMSTSINSDGSITVTPPPPPHEGDAVTVTDPDPHA